MNFWIFGKNNLAFEERLGWNAFAVCHFGKRFSYQLFIVFLISGKLAFLDASPVGSPAGLFLRGGQKGFSYC